MFSRAEPFVQFGKRALQATFCEITLNFNQWSSRRCHFKNLVVFALSAILLDERYQLICNFGRGHYGEHSCEFIEKSSQWCGRCLSKIFLILNTDGHFYFVQWIKIVCAILVEDIMRNISVELT